MDAFELLKADHKKVAELFDQLEEASGKEKLNLFERIKNELELHTHVEETIFYPALEKPEETHDLILEAYEEHKMVKTLLSELDGAKSADDEWQAKAKVLRENVEHHVEEEENELFDKANDALSDEQIEALGERMESAKAQKQSRPAPTRPVAKAAESTEPSAEKPGLLAKIANFVGLGGGTAKKKKGRAAAKKGGTAGQKARPAAKKGAKKASPKKGTAARKGTKVNVKAASKNKARKSSGATVSKSSPTARGSKRAPGSRATIGAKKRSGTGSGKKAAKKGASRK